MTKWLKISVKQTIYYLRYFPFLENYFYPVQIEHNERAKLWIRLATLAHLHDSER